MRLFLDTPKPIETLLNDLIEASGLTTICFARTPFDGRRAILVPYTPVAKRFKERSIGQIEESLLIPHEKRYRDPSESATSLTSLVRMREDSDWDHLTLVDLRLVINSRDEESSVRKAIETIQDTSIGGLDNMGALVKSGNGFHYYGSTLRSDDAWVEWMRKLRSIPAVGLTYPTYKLQDGFAAVRVGTHPQHRPFKPVVVASWTQSVNC